jgi:archaellum component FlaF (FlaF/FlaG flagellin family)
MAAFSRGCCITPQAYPAALSIASDLNSDGKLDLSIQSDPSGGPDVFWGNGDGTFAPPQIFPSGESGYPVAGDFNGDRLPDFAFANELYLTTMLNTGVASFFPSGPLIFPLQLIHSQGQASVRLTNSGTGPLTIRSMKAVGEFQANNTCGDTVAPGASCRITAEFKPASSGSYAGSIEIVDSASSKPQFIELSARATAVKLSTASLKFGDQKVGTKSKVQTITVTNEGSTALAFSSINILGDFSETNTCVSGELAPGGSCSVAVIFAPTKSGPRTGTLYINVQGGFGPPHVGLSVIGD